MKDGVSTRPGQLVVVTTDLASSRTGTSTVTPIWYERTTNMRLYASHDNPSWLLHIANEIYEYGVCVVFTGSLKTALDLPLKIEAMAKPLGIQLETIITSPQSMPKQVRLLVEYHERWGSALLSELPDALKRV